MKIGKCVVTSLPLTRQVQVFAGVAGGPDGGGFGDSLIAEKRDD